MSAGGWRPLPPEREGVYVVWCAATGFDLGYVAEVDGRARWRIRGIGGAPQTLDHAPAGWWWCDAPLDLPPTPSERWFEAVKGPGDARPERST